MLTFQGSEDITPRENIHIGFSFADCPQARIINALAKSVFSIQVLVIILLDLVVLNQPQKKNSDITHRFATSVILVMS